MDVNINLPINSLYRTGYIFTFADGEAILVRDIMPIEATEEDRYHTVVQLDSLERLAYKYYSQTIEDSSKFWWVIADANNIENPLDISNYIGQLLLIPNILNILLKLED